MIHDSLSLLLLYMPCHRLIHQQHQIFRIITFLLLFVQNGTQSILLLNVKVPPYVQEGTKAKIICMYEIELDGLYSLKLYKDDNEFYSYIPRQNKKKRFFTVPGVDIEKSKNLGNMTYVVLRNISDESAGEYKCQVSGEGPLFNTETQSKRLRVAVIPKGPPHIKSVPAEYSIGQWVNLNCTSEPSRPPARLTWIVNNAEADDDMIRKFFSPTISPLSKFSTTSNTEELPERMSEDDTTLLSKHKTTSHDNSIEELSRKAYQTTPEKEELRSRVLALQFWLREEHFVQGRLIVKCVAEINSVYYDETASYIISKHRAQHKVLQARSSSANVHISRRCLRSICCHDAVTCIFTIFILSIFIFNKI